MENLETNLRTVRLVQDELETLEGFGWKIRKDAEKVLTDFDATLADLATTQRDIEALPAQRTPEHEKKLGELLNRESYLEETLDGLVRRSRQVLSDEQRAFFEARDKFLAPINNDENKASASVVNAVRELHRSLQEHWNAKLRLFLLQKELHRIESSYGGEIVVRLPFKKKLFTATWRSYVTAWIEHISDRIADGENVLPEDILK